uniref:Salivary protein n=1 Tax=Ixodes sinensis TaxID=339422 RepID=I4IY14_IXOSI|nr:salp15 Is-1 [Ixodes sinensis]CCI50998.1 salivary protein [Ixodes sinensis]
MESFVAMKVVCILFLFVVVAEAASVVKNSEGDASNGKKTPIQFKFPSYVPDHYGFASSLLRICKEHTPKPQEGNYGSENEYNPRINDLQVDFKNCTFLCKRKFYNVTLDLPPKTPCGPNKQTCEKKEECVPHIPGC